MLTLCRKPNPGSGLHRLMLLRIKRLLDLLTKAQTWTIVAHHMCHSLLQSGACN